MEGMMVPKPDGQIVQIFANEAVTRMTVFVDETSLYKNFPKTHITLTDELTGCRGGVGRSGTKLVPLIELCLPHITDYTLGGFQEYKHIEDDAEIGTVDRPVSWKHVVMVILCHELAHAVVNMHDITKRHGLYVPKTYHAYSIDLIETQYAKQKRLHGRKWQYTYRQLRNEFVNNKLSTF